MEVRKGRPRSISPKDERFYIRVEKEEKEEIMNFARKNGYTLLDLIRIGMKYGDREKNKAVE